MRGVVSWFVLALAGCDAILGIHDVTTQGSGMPDADLPPGNDALGSSCVTIPTWGNVMQFSSPNTTSLAVGDLAGSGFVDVVVSVGSDLELFPNSGSGIYASVAPLRASPSPADVVFVADLNDDHKADVIAEQLNAGSGAAELAFYLQDATTSGTFDAPTTFALPAGLTVCGVADLNNDGFADLLLCGGSVVVALSGSGTFTAAAMTTIDSAPAQAAALDIDADGLPDIAVTGVQGTPAEVAFNTKATPGTFGALAPIGTLAAGAVTFGEFAPNPGRSALVTGPSIQDTLFDQTSPRVFIEHSQLILALPTGGGYINAGVDLNGDGHDDIVEPEPGAFELQCDQFGTFFPSSTGAPLDEVLMLPIRQIEFVGDLNGDGKPDLIGFAQIAVPGAPSQSVFQVALHE